MNQNFPAKNLWQYQMKKSNGRWTRCRIAKPADRYVCSNQEREMPPWAVRSLVHILRLLAALSSEK